MTAAIELAAVVLSYVLALMTCVLTAGALVLGAVAVMGWRAR